MPKLIILGTSNAIPDESHENTHMVLVGNARTILIDCVNNQLLRLKKAGVDYSSLTDLILTHFHPDHVSGVPQLLMNMWLMGHQQPLSIYGLEYTLDRLKELMGFYGWSDWPGFFPVTFYPLPTEEMVPVLECEEMSVHASPVQHMIPAIGLRFVFKQTNKVLAYSCDTEPCDQVIRLAEGADVLIHEASGDILGHSSAAQAGEIANKAQVGALYLIHYPTGPFSEGDPVHEAGGRFKGPVTLTEDLMALEL